MQFPSKENAVPVKPNCSDPLTEGNTVNIEKVDQSLRNGGNMRRYL